MKLKTILNNLKFKLTRRLFNDFANDCDEWYQSQEFEELIQAYEMAEKDYKFVKAA